MFWLFKSPEKSSLMTMLVVESLSLSLICLPNMWRNIDLLDVDYATMIQICYINENGKVKNSNIIIPVLGDNLYQLLLLAKKEVKGPIMKLSVIMSWSAGISLMTFCIPLDLHQCQACLLLHEHVSTQRLISVSYLMAQNLLAATILTCSTSHSMESNSLHLVDSEIMFCIFLILPRLEMLLLVILIWDHQIRYAQEEECPWKEWRESLPELWLPWKHADHSGRQ